MIKGGKSGTDIVSISFRILRNFGIMIGIGIIMEGMTWGIGGIERRGMGGSIRKRGSIYLNLFFFRG